jgi:hypothetical protein
MSKKMESGAETCVLLSTVQGCLVTLMLVAMLWWMVHVQVSQTSAYDL